MEVELKTIISTPISQLLQQGEVTMGYVDKINLEKGHIVLKFPQGYAPRLKVLKSFVVVKKNAFATFGSQIKEWKCTLGDFKIDTTMHTIGSDLLPLFFVTSNDRYEYVECSNVTLTLFNLLKDALDAGKSLTVLIYDPFPPVDYFLNLKRFMDLYPNNDELLIEPKIAYEDWHPEELSYDAENPDAIAKTISNTLEKEKCCILQGPPGTGKSYVIATIIAGYVKSGKNVCATTMANKSLIELITQEPLREVLESGKISKTNVSADEKRQAPGLKNVTNGLLVPAGEVLCSTNYILSGAFNPKNVETRGIPSFDLVVIEEASQAFLTTLVAFKLLGKACLIVGDPMQLPPIVKSLNKPQYKLFNTTAQVEGMTTYALGTNIKSYRIITSHRLTPESVKLTGMFYNNRLSSVNVSGLDFTIIKDPHFLPYGGVLYEVTNDMRNSMCSDTAIAIIRGILAKFKDYYPEAEVAIIAPFKDTVKELQKNFLTIGALPNLIIETVDRIQGMTVDYAIMYFPGWKPSFALDVRRFNVSTSRSRTTTLILSDVSLENMHSAPDHVISFLKSCHKLKNGKLTSPIENNTPDNQTVETKQKETNDILTVSHIPGPKIVGSIDISQFERPKKELKKNKQNYYVIDTNVFVNCPEVIAKIDYKYPVILSAKVIDELDRLKIKLDDAGKSNVQKALRSINQSMDNRDVKMVLADVSLLPDDFDKRSPDNMILTVALKFKDENPILLTSDIGLQVKAKGLGLTTISLKEFLKR
jgi:rRNA-processing protein FCF1/energy-coupling factor transporter ATP-binding protein EcfA2